MLKILYNLVSLIAILAIKRLNVIQSYSVGYHLISRKQISNWNYPPQAKIFRICDFSSNLEHFSSKKVVKSGGALSPHFEKCGALAPAPPASSTPSLNFQALPKPPPQTVSRRVSLQELQFLPDCWKSAPNWMKNGKF